MNTYRLLAKERAVVLRRIRRHPPIIKVRPHTNVKDELVVLLPKEKEKLVIVKPKRVKLKKIHRVSFRDWLNAHKIQEGCVDCGFNKWSEALDFDHIDPTTKSFDISKGIKKYAKTKVLAEIAKCEIVCANCHRHRTFLVNQERLLEKQFTNE